MDGDKRQLLVRALGADDVESAVRRLGFEYLGTPVEGPALRAWGVEPALMEGVGRLRILAAPQGARLLHLDSDVDWVKVRRLVLAVYRAAPEATVLWWWSSPNAWTLAMADGDRNDRPRVRRLVLEREYPDEVGLMQWLALSPQRRVDSATAVFDGQRWRDHFAEILDQDGVTRQFFERFSDGLDELIETMEHGPDDEELRHEVALGTLLRVVFLYFLQARGALDGDRRFVMRHFRDPSREGSFYRGVLRPLFFGALNCPRHNRDGAARALGDLPFLNGGLFEPTAVEEAHPDLDWDDEIWRGLLENLFERHRFAVEWSDGLDGTDLCRAVDPEMLGKVFEGLMYGDRRKKSGSFYTPRDVVRQMVGDTLIAWLAEAADLDEQKASTLVEGRAEELSGRVRRRAREAMADISILDPAVGTGAFLLESLRVLRRIDDAFDRAAGVVRTPGERYERMRRLVHDHLCGVDVQPTAVRLCELRIWLAMLAALPDLPAREMPPLPNLSHRLCSGNALVDPLDWVRFRVARESTSFGGTRPGYERRAVDRLATLQDAYTRSHGEEKRELKRAIEKMQREVEVHLLGARAALLRKRLKPLKALASSQELFEERDQLDAGQRAEKERLEAELEAIEQARSDVGADRRRGAAFSFDVHFAPMMARGGFDVIVTNPPWVRESRIDGATRKLYKARFDSSDHRLWPRASKMGVRATFGAQVDMAALFLERSLELLKPGGRLCGLVPIKLFRSLHGAGLRAKLGDHRIEFLEDRSGDDQAMFDATTYPAILRVRKEEKPPVQPLPLQVSVWRQGRPKSFRRPARDLTVLGGDLREPWMLVEPEVSEIFRKMQARSVPLGEVSELPIRRGVMTGCNAAFLLDPEEAREKFCAEVREKYLRWALRGRDIEPEQISRQKQIIWPVDEHGQILESLPAQLEAHFEEFRGRLERRSDYRGGPIWTLFRRHHDICRPGVVWRDMGEKLEAAVCDGATIPLNTVYYLAAGNDEAAQAVVELFHSEPVRAMAYAVGERARGGWRRHFSWVMRMLPVPKRWLEEMDGGVCGVGAIREMYGLSGGEIEALREWRRVG